MYRRLIPAVLAAIFSQAHSAAPPVTDTEAVVVTATRFADPDPHVPSNISVIGREEIQNSPALNLPDLLRTRAGVNISPMYGSLGTDAMVDLRGFGEIAGSNTLVLIDGLRVNPIDSGNLVWSAIPLSSIQRIEIQRGAGTVLYGDRASGGVINIVTDKSGASHTSLSTSVGSNGYRGLDAAATGSNDFGYASVFAHAASSEGWRQNNQQDQQAISGRLGHYIEGGELALDYAAFKESAGLPGYLTDQAYQANPRAARTSLDSQTRDGYRVRPGVKLKLSNTLTLEAELTDAAETQHWNSVSFNSVSDRKKHTQSLTPRLLVNHGLGNLPSETVIGLDYYHGTVDASSTTWPTQGASQTSTAYYAQNSTALTDALTITTGLRSQRLEQQVHQDATPGPFGSPALDGRSVRTQTAYDLGASYDTPDWRVYGKLGSTFRFANTDELFGYNFVTYASVFAGDLKPQHGTIQELGGNVRLGQIKLRGALYRMDMKDEIGYDSATGPLGANVNFDPTRRQGLEAEAYWRINSQFKARFAYTYTDASFRSGPYAGHAVPLVPRDKASAQLSYEADSAISYSAVVNAVGNRAYGGDRLGTQGKLPGYATMDLIGIWNVQQFKLSARVLNLFDKRYAAYAGYATYLPPPGLFYYPADGRSLFLSLGYDFK